MAATVAQFVSRKSQQAFMEYHKYASVSVERHQNMRQKMRDIDLAYLRENDRDKESVRAKNANTRGDPSKFQNITVPVIKPQINSAVAYQAGVFLTDYPIFGVVSDPAFMDAARQFQSILEENSIRGAWVRQLLLFFFDGFKYNISAIEATWDKVVTAALDTEITYKGGKEGKPKEIIWAGNCLKRWDMYNSYWDTRCEPFDIPTRGDFAGHTEIMSRTALKSFIASLDTKLVENINPAFMSPNGAGSIGSDDINGAYYIPELNSSGIINPNDVNSVDWASWMGLSGSKTPQGNIGQGMYQVSTEYVRIIPADFEMKVPAPNTPQVWKQIIVNHSIPIYIERQTNAHEKIPVFFGCPSEDGLAYQAKSFATETKPFQDVATALMNAIVHGRRRAITDRVLYDPSRISEAHINSPNPSAKIPIRPAAYGKPVGEAVYAFPYRDDQAGLQMQEIQMVLGLGNTLVGQNQARQGQFVKGNKTDSQWEGVMSNATSRDQMTALLYEAQVFTGLKEVLKINTMQYQAAGTVYSPSTKQNVAVDPIALRKAVLNFKVTDGLLSTDKVISSDSLKVAMQVLGSSQVLASGYNIVPLFSYIMKAENTDLAPFEKKPEQMAFEQAMSAWSQAANLALTKGAAFNTPQPTPEQYGYVPAQQMTGDQNGNNQSQ